MSWKELLGVWFVSYVVASSSSLVAVCFYSNPLLSLLSSGGCLAHRMRVRVIRRWSCLKIKRQAHCPSPKIGIHRRRRPASTTKPTARRRACSIVDIAGSAAVVVVLSRHLVGRARERHGIGTTETFGAKAVRRSYGTSRATAPGGRSLIH